MTNVPRQLGRVARGWITGVRETRRGGQRNGYTASEERREKRVYIGKEEEEEEEELPPQARESSLTSIINNAYRR